MKILLTGSNGLVGNRLLEVLKANSGYSIVATSKDEDRSINKEGYIYESLDITDEAAVDKVISRHAPDVIVHAAAITQADVCEMNQPLCTLTNVDATSYLLSAALKCGAHFIFLSTDFVFSGDEGPYKEDDFPSPVNFYGTSKLSAEEFVKQYPYSWSIVRTVLVYGINEVTGRHNMFSWVYESLKEGTPIKVVNDQFRTPTLINDLVKGIEMVIRNQAKGIFHISGKDELTPYEMAVKIAKTFQFNGSLISEVNASVFVQPAKRPPKTGFIIDKARKELGYEPMSFDDALDHLLLSVGR